MFREMRRFKQQVANSECVHILESEKRGVLSLIVDDGYPYGIPMDFYYDKEENVIYFHGAGAGQKIDAIKACDKVCFTTWNKGFQKDGDWAWNVTSVVCFGRAELMDDMEKATQKARLLGIKYYPRAEEVEVEIEESMHHCQMIALHVEHMTGKLVNEK